MEKSGAHPKAWNDHRRNLKSSLNSSLEHELEHENEYEELKIMAQERKQPLLAAVLSIIPGLGQVYNDQPGKGLFIFSILLVSIFLLIVGHIHLPGFNMNFGSGDTFSLIPGHVSYKVGFLYKILWGLLILPLIYIYAIADAVQTAHRINARWTATGTHEPLGGFRTMSNEAFNPQTAGQANFQNQAYTNTGGASSPQGGPTPPPKAPPHTPPHAPPPPPKGRKRIGGKLFLGMVLLMIGVFGFLISMNINIFEILIIRLWPLIPLLFGLRMLKDYRFHRDSSQKTLGIIFTLVGGISLIGTLSGWPIWGAIFNNWWLLFIAVGCFFILLEITGQKRYRHR